MGYRRLAALCAFAFAIGLLPGWVGAQGKKDKDDSLKASSTGAGGMAMECVSPQAEKEVASCPANAPKFSKKSVLGQSQAPASQLQTASRRKEKVKDRVKGPSIEIDAATLRNREKMQTRARRLLDREVRVLNRLVKNTPPDSPKRPDILLRLAETYFELQQQANATVRSFDDPIYEARKAKNKAKFKQLKGQQKKANDQLKKFRKAAIAAYAKLVKDHPNFRRMDEVLFALGFSLEEMKQPDRAREVYYRLIKNYPQSKFVPNAYLSFAEHYFSEGDMKAANRFYKKVTEFPPERNQVFGYALYKQAWCQYNLEDFKGALTRFVEVIEFGQNNPNARDVKNLVKQSRRELVLPYAMAGTPKKALPFFRRFAKDDSQTFEMLESLAELYYDTGAWNNTISVYHTLMSEKPDDAQVCYWQTRVTNAVLSKQKKKASVVEVQRMIDVYETYSQAGHKADVQTKCKQAAAEILIELATAWHREAIGTSTQPGTNDRNTMEQSSKLYKLLLDKFPDMAKLKFPRIDKRDWPTEYKVSYYYAELLWKMENWAQCAPAFDKVVELNPKGKYTADAALASVLCYNNLYQQSFQANERTTSRGGKKKKRGKKGKKKEPEIDYTRKEMNSLQQGMLNAFQRYVCFVPDSDDLPTMKYRRARIYYESNQFQEASVIFKDIAYNHRDDDLAEYAANLYLDSLNVLGSMRGDKNPQCYEDMEKAVPDLIGYYCKTEEQRDDHESLCTVLLQLRCDILRKKAEAYQDSKAFRDAAYTYVEVFRKYKECGKLDEVLYNAALNFEAAKLIGRAIKVRSVLIDKFPESKLAKRSIYLVGANFQALALYSRAADYYEQFAKRFPSEVGKDCSDADKEAGTCPIAYEALQDAVFFRLGLGDDEKAVSDAKLYEKNFKRKKPREASQVNYALASIYERQNDWKAIAKHYKSYLSKYKRQAMPHEKLRANVQIGRAMWEQDKKRDAERYFKAAVKLWQQDAEGKIKKLAGDGGDGGKWLAEAQQATAEALWYLAEYRFADFKKIKFPELKKKRGKLDLKMVNEWATGPFVKWMESKAKSLKVAEDAFAKVRDLKAPMWDIAAAARVGVMYREFVDEFRDAPVPDEIKKDPELMDIYLESLDTKSQPWVVKATGAFDFCLSLATKIRWFNDFSEQCELELNKLDPKKFPMAAELRGKPGYVHREVARPTPVELGAGDERDDEE